MQNQNRFRFYGFVGILAIVFMIMTQSFVVAQDVTVKGKITNATNNEAVPGVNISVKGAAIGTITDLDGNYTISVPPTATLVVASVGFVTVEVPVNGQSTLDIALKEDVSNLQEVVITGYGTRLREELTGSVSTVSSDDMKISTAPSALGRMQGQVSGITVVNANTPGGNAVVRVRGLGTINNNEPLYVIDGVPADPGNNLNPNDIETISVLKDASSAAIYGTRGANGVILITTKRGKAGDKPTVTFSTRIGMAKAINQYDMLNSQEYAESLWLKAANTNTTPGPASLYGNGTSPVLPDYLTPTGASEGATGTTLAEYSKSNVITKANKAGTNWYDEIYQTGKTLEYDLSIAGGTQNTTYAFSAGYLDQEGILINTGFKRYSFRSNVDAKVTEWLKVGQSLSASFTNSLGDMGSDGEGTPISQAYRMQPIIPVYDIAGNFAGTKSGPQFGNADNPVAMLTRNQNNFYKNARAMGNFFLEAKIMEGLKFKSLFGFDYSQGNQKTTTLANPEMSEARANDALSQYQTYTVQWNWTNTLSYDKTFGNHRISAIAGTEAIANNWTESGAGRAIYFSQDFDYMQLNSGEATQTNYGRSEQWSLFSIFGRVNYDLKSKYLLELTVRRDGSSRFSEANRYGVFPAVSAGWILTQEDFMAGTSSWLNFLKLRAGWGKSGNDRIGNYNSYTTYGINKIQSAYTLDGSDNGLTQGAQPVQYGNTDVTWEKTTTTDIGFDTRFLNNTLSFGMDVWQRKTTDMLYQVQKPWVSGVANQPYLNIGDMTNTGFDIELGYANNAMGGKFTYSISATISRYVNEITKLSNNSNEYIATATERQVEYSRAAVGHAFPEFFGYQVEGIFQTQAEADAWPANGSYNAPGHYKFADVNEDGVITAADRTFIGSPHPDFTGGVNINLAYGGFDLGMVFYGSYGNDMVNYVRRWIDYGQFDGGLSKDALYSSWGSPYLANNADATLPMYDLSSISQQNSSAFVEDGSFLRMKSLQLGYNLPKSILGKAKISSVNVYLQVTNLFTLTKYSGLDPEYYSSGGTMGLDRGAWPTPRQIMFGLSLSL